MTIRNNKTLGEIIKEVMKERGIKASVVARKMNVSRQTINQIDARKKFDIEFLQKLKDATELDFTSYAYDDLNRRIPEEDKEKYFNSTAEQKISLQISVSCSVDKLTNFSDFINEMNQIAKKYGFSIS